MHEAELSLLFVRPLNLLGVRYIVSGSMAAILYGEPRLTHDVDFVVSLVRKLEYYREGGSEKHLRDIRSMLAVSAEQLDHVALDEWIGRRGLGPEWNQVRA